MGNLIFMYAMLTIGIIEARTAYILGKAGEAHSMNARLPLCILIMLHYFSPWIYEVYLAGSGILYMAALWISESLLLTVVIYILSQRIERHFMRRNNNGE